ncbi:MAG: class I SAM-dependent methyltransferase [Chloroflexota bacterium]
MSQSHNSEEIIQEALNLDGTVDKLQSFYAKWAASYDMDVATEAYAAPTISVDLLLKNLHQLDQLSRPLSILDAGCGTGLIGQILLQSDLDPTFELDGFDLSSAMVDKAAETKAYTNLMGNINLNHPLHHLFKNQYDVVFCCGVFTLGHVPPKSLKNLFDVTRSGGLVIASTRTRYYEKSGYQTISDKFVAEGAVELVELLREAPYTSDDNSHYWVYKLM